MLGEGSVLVGTIVGSGLVGVLLGWTALVYCQGRRRWRALDPLLLVILGASCLRQLSVAGGAGLLLFRPAPPLACSLMVWVRAALHALQAAALAWLALASRRPTLASHLGYHLGSTLLLCSCLGLAAVLSVADPCCPGAADPRYVIFSLAFHGGLALLCVGGLALHCCPRRSRPAPASSASDLSSSAASEASRLSRHCLVAELLLKADPAYMSTTSSTNSRACLARPRPPEPLPTVTAVAVVLIGLAANHIPVLVVEASEVLGAGNWGAEGRVPEWGAVLEGLLLPLVLALCDRAFLDRVASVYTRPKPYDLPRPTQGVYGKFRRFGASEGQPVRFPLTNGSLFTSLDGRGCLLRHYHRPHPPVVRDDLWMMSGLHHHQHGLQGHHLGAHVHGHVPPQSSVEQLRVLLGSSPEEEIYATLSSLRSTCSATTAANDDFEYYHQHTNQGLHEEKQAEEEIKVRQENSERRSPEGGGRKSGWRRSLPPVLSVESLAAALAQPGVSYLDTGDLCTHKSDSVPDLKRVFLTDYL